MSSQNVIFLSDLWLVKSKWLKFGFIKDIYFIGVTVAYNKNGYRYFSTPLCTPLYILTLPIGPIKECSLFPNLLTQSLAIWLALAKEANIPQTEA